MDKAIIIALVISYLLDKHVERNRQIAETKKIEQETRKLELEIKKLEKKKK